MPTDVPTDVPMDEFYGRLIAHYEKLYPKTAAKLPLREHLSPLLFCADVLELPVSIKTQAEEIVSAFFKLREVESRRKKLEQIEPLVADPGNTSALMSYDFHLGEDDRLRLIEINTNASQSLLIDGLREMQNVENPYSKDFRNEIFATFGEEAVASGIAPVRTAAITDADPKAQRLFAEFEFFAELFTAHGWKTQIVDTKDFTFTESLQAAGEKIDLVYNRNTDFYLQSETNSALHQAMQARAACVSPHPHEYRLLADKERLLELSRPGAIAALALDEASRKAIARTLIPTIAVSDIEDSTQLWAARKKYFFKPMRSFGGKATYRGSSITRSTFAHVMKGEYVAQEFVPAPELHLPSVDARFKYDLRFYVYRDRIQLCCARFYQGQMTNSQTLGGGIAPIAFNLRSNPGLR